MQLQRNAEHFEDCKFYSQMEDFFVNAHEARLWWCCPFDKPMQPIKVRTGSRLLTIRFRWHRWFVCNVWPPKLHHLKYVFYMQNHFESFKFHFLGQGNTTYFLQIEHFSLFNENKSVSNIKFDWRLWRQFQIG